MDLLADDDAYDGVLAAALALIDDVYDAKRFGPTPRRRGVRCPRQEIQQLRLQVEQLQQTLDVTRHDLHTGDARATDFARLWARVAYSQRTQRETVVVENAVLQHTARGQRERAKSVLAFLESVRSALMEALPKPEAIGRLGVRSSVPPLLLRRLDDVTSAIDPSCPMEIAGNPYRREHSTHWNATQTALRVRLRSSGRYPFKLSSVARALWELMQEDAMEHERQVDADAVSFANATLQLRKPFGGLEVHGPMALRRTYPPEGGVLFTGVSVMYSTEDEASNLMAQLEFRETMWIRVVHVNPSSPTSPVFVQSTSDFDVIARTDKEVADVLQGDDIVLRLQRLESFMQRYAVEDRGDGRQKLENRLLDAAIAADKNGSREILRC